MKKTDKAALASFQIEIELKTLSSGTEKTREKLALSSLSTRPMSTI